MHAAEPVWPSVVRDFRAGGRERDVAAWTVVTDALKHAETLVPHRPPPQGDGRVAELVGLARTRDLGQLSVVVSLDDSAKALGAYREALTWWEAEASRRLERLAWCHGECMRMAARHPTAGEQFDALARKFERYALDAWGVETLSEDRGWAMRQVRRYDLLPTLLREWK